jgi:hypothetical protein
VGLSISTTGSQSIPHLPFPLTSAGSNQVGSVRRKRRKWKNPQLPNRVEETIRSKYLKEPRARMRVLARETEGTASPRQTNESTSAAMSRYWRCT